MGIKIEFAHICENVIVALNGNLSIINTFNQISARNFPAVNNNFIIVIGVIGEAGEYPVRIKIIKQGERTPTLDFNPDIKMKVPISPAQGRFFANLSPVVFKFPGFYEVDIQVGDQNKKLYFEIKSKL